MTDFIDHRASFSQFVLHAWDSNVSRTGNLLKKLSDVQLHREIAPGKNRGIYLLGHLIAYHDAMGQLLGISERTHADLDTVFLFSPDEAGSALPPTEVLRQDWTTVHDRLAEQLAHLSPDDWLGPHTAVSAEDFTRQPHRNKLNVLLSRTNHLAYHLGQLMLLKS